MQQVQAAPVAEDRLGPRSALNQMHGKSRRLRGRRPRENDPQGMGHAQDAVSPGRVDGM